MAAFGFSPAPGSVPAARRYARDRLTALGVPDDVAETALLLVSEIVTNVTLHARTEGLLDVVVEGEGLRLSVTDGSRARPRLRRYGARESTGRGLRMVHGLAAESGVVACSDVAVTGKTVWCLLPLQPTPEQVSAQEAALADLFDLGPLDLDSCG